MKAGWSPATFPLKVFAMSNVAPLGKAKARGKDFKDKIRMRRNYVFPAYFCWFSFASQASEVASADVVICSYRLLYSQIYLNRRKER